MRLHGKKEDAKKMRKEAEAEAGEYHSKDFEWETLKQEIENDPSHQFHLLPFDSSPIPLPPPPPPQQPLEEATQVSNAWQRFHLRHSSAKFFKERRYLLKEFPELVSCGHFSKLLEVGCGNGSSVLPILRGNESIEVYACDCSSEILDTVRRMLDGVDLVGVQQRLHLFQCDFAYSGFPNWLKCHSCRGTFGMTQRECLLPVEDASALVGSSSCSSEASGCCIGGVDFVTLIFVLSAVPLKRMPTAIRECYSILKPGGQLLFRDYGLYDMTMLRFNSDKRVGFREYMRSDGTRSYFFSLDSVRDLFLGAGFVEIELEYCCISSVNRQKGKCMRRVWVHGKFQRPMHGHQ